MNLVGSAAVTRRCANDVSVGGGLLFGVLLGSLERGDVILESDDLGFEVRDLVLEHQDVFFGLVPHAHAGVDLAGRLSGGIDELAPADLGDGTGAGHLGCRIGDGLGVVVGEGERDEGDEEHGAPGWTRSIA